MNFVNDYMPLESLPRYESVPLTPIDRKYRYVIFWNWLFIIVFCMAIVLIFFLESAWRPYRWLAAGAAVLLVASWGVLHLQAFKRRAFAVRTHDVIYRHGILSVATTVIPFNRIQHVTVREGVIARWYALASIQVFTAGGASSDLKINGLPKNTAESVKAAILQKIQQ